MKFFFVWKQTLPLAVVVPGLAIFRVTHCSIYKFSTFSYINPYSLKRICFATFYWRTIKRFMEKLSCCHLDGPTTPCWASLVGLNILARRFYRPSTTPSSWLRCLIKKNGVHGRRFADMISSCSIPTSSKSHLISSIGEMPLMHCVDDDLNAHSRVGVPLNY